MASLASLSVLVVDESEAFLAGIRPWIEARSDLRLVGTAPNAFMALEAIDQLSPDLVIVEAVLPMIDGFRLTRALKGRANPPLVVVVTFHASAAARDEALAAGADGFLAKGDLSDQLDALLQLWQTERPTSADDVTTPARRAPRESQSEPAP